MRRTLFAFLAMMLLVPAGLLLAQDPPAPPVRLLSQPGDLEARIVALRSRLSARPDDDALKQELIDTLGLKQRALRQQLADLDREISALRPRLLTSTVGCGEANQFPVRVGGHIRQPQKTLHVPPVYPQVAQSARVQGIVILEASIDCTGAVTDAKVLRGQPLLNEAAIESVLQWRYDPALLEGKPVPVIMTVTVTFSLQ